MDKTIKVYGMTCQNCKHKIEKNLNKTKGINSAKVDLLNKQVKIKYNQNQISLDEIKNTIKNLGYSLNKNKKKTFFQALTYGIIPHIGCIAFIIASIVGAGAIVTLFKPLMMNRFFFYFLILISIAFATISSAFYLGKQNALNPNGLKRNKSYLATMYSTTIGVNLLLFFVIFPLTANVTIQQNLESQTSSGTQINIKQIVLDVDIPCPGHAPLISNELQTLGGIQNINYDFPSKFKIEYDSSITNKDDIFNLEVFKSYPATEVTTQ